MLGSAQGVGDGLRWMFETIHSTGGDMEFRQRIRRAVLASRLFGADIRPRLSYFGTDQEQQENATRHQRILAETERIDRAQQQATSLVVETEVWGQSLEVPRDRGVQQQRDAKAKSTQRVLTLKLSEALEGQRYS